MGDVEQDVPRNDLALRLALDVLGWHPSSPDFGDRVGGLARHMGAPGTDLCEAVEAFVAARLRAERQAIFLALHPECPVHPGMPNACDESLCDCFGADNLAEQIRVRLAAATEERERLRAMLSEALDEWGYWFSNADQADYDKRDIAKWRARIDEMRAALAEGGS